MKNKSMMNGILNNPKVFLFISIILAFIADLMSTVMIFKAGYELQYLLFPLVILIMDILFFVLSIFSNYRFRYSILQMVAYLIVVLSGVGAVTILFATSVNEIIMTIISCVLWASVHVLGLVAVLVNSLHASKVSKKSKKFVPITSITLLTALVVIFTASICHNGFFGQGYIEEARTLSYVYSEEDEGYIVQSTLKGRGNTAIIPMEFNGKPVVAIDCEMLKEEDLRAVRFEKGHSNIKFKNTENLKDYELNPDMTFYAEKEDIDNIKNTLFSYWSNDSKTGILKLTNTFYPTNLGDNEVYITFSYTNEAYDNVNGVVFKTWFGQKGDIFDITFDDQVPYALHSNLTDDDLHWNYNNNNKLILKSLLDDKGNLINGLEINDSIKNVQVDFEKIYAVKILEDNDTKYETEDSYRYTYLDDSTLEYKYVLEDTANDLTDSIPLRDGFDLRFKYDNYSISSLKQIILEEGNNDIIEISPFWELKAPANLEVYTNNHNNTFTYGDNVVLSGDFDEVTNGILYTYNWSFGSNNYNGDDYSLKNVVPSQSGKYVLTVTAYSDTITSLTSKASKELNITINKKVLNFDWVLPTNLVYSGENKTISCNYDASQVINNDSITFSINEDEIYNAGRYNFKVTLTGSCNDLYEIPTSDSSISFEIEKKEVGLIWEEVSYIYNGQKQVPNVYLEGIIGIDSCDVNVSVNGGVNAGTYTVVATSLTNNNYKLPSFNTHVYSIDKKTIQANVNNGSGVYNDYYNAATASLIGVEDGDIVNVIITYVGRANDGTNYNSTVVPQKAGTYDAVVTINNSNYNLEETKGLFVMEKATLEIPNITSKTYTGNKLSANTLNSSLYEITRNVEETNVGNYIVEVSLLDSNNYKWANSSNVTIEATFSITKADNLWTTNPTITGWIYGKSANDPIYRAKFGVVTVEYCTSNGSSWSTNVPKEAGAYKVRFTVEDTNNYSGLVKEVDFVIEKATVSVPTISSKTYTGNNLVADVPNSDLYTVTLNEGGINVGSNYEVQLTLNDSNNYRWTTSNESTISIYFTIKQAQNSWTTTPSITGWAYGDLANDPEYAAKFGTVKVEYSSNNGSTWTEEVPVNAGHYLVRFTVVETSNYAGITATKAIEITAKEINAYVEYGGGVYDSIINPVTVTFNGVLYGDDVGVIITYSGTSNSGVSYNGTIVPTEAGTYTVTIKITNNNYSFTKVTGSFVIEKAENSWATTPSITGWTYGDLANDPEYASKYGTVKVEYSSNNGSTWSTKVPTNAGTYKVRFVVNETGNYTGLSYETSLVIERKEITANVINGGGTYGSVTPVTVTLNGVVDGDNVKVTITYTGEGYNSTEVPTEAGTYTATITINEPNYNLIVVPVTFVISQAENVWEQEPVIEGWVEGETPNTPSYDSKYGTVKVEYSSNNGSSWSTNVPEEAGTYKVRFTVEETKNYTGLTKEISFEIEEANDLENN